MQADLDILRNLDIARLTPDSKTLYVRLVDIPQPFRAEFRAWMSVSQCPVISGEDIHGCMYQHDFEDYRRDRLTGNYKKWGMPPWEIHFYVPPEADDPSVD
jgi:hypothetical protein